LDFPAEIGTTIQAAAGGMVFTVEWHPQYGHLFELDHGNGLATRYAHVSKSLVKPGDIVRRGKVVALIGSSWRSTGSHPSPRGADGRRAAGDPARFLAGSARALSFAQGSPRP
jgi:septal ring factor EnvC (AmiA/AmiB activator)